MSRDLILVGLGVFAGMLLSWAYGSAERVDTEASDCPTCEAEARADADLERERIRWRASFAVTRDEMWETILFRMQPPPPWLPLGTRSRPVHSPEGPATFSTYDQMVRRGR